MSQPVLILPRRFGDKRGWFVETYQAERFHNIGIDDQFIQDNEAFSQQKSTFRGLHFQSPPHAQAKLVRCISGRILDIFIDIRKGSPTFGQKHQVELTSERGEIVYVPVGYAHGYLTLTENTLVCYKVTSGYAPHSEGGVRIEDPKLMIELPVERGNLLINDRDQRWPDLDADQSPFIDDGKPFHLKTVEI